MIIFTLYSNYTYCHFDSTDDEFLIRDLCSHKIRRFVSKYTDRFGNQINLKDYRRLPFNLKRKYSLKAESISSSISYYYDKYKSFPSGWLPRFIKILNDNDIQYCVSDKRKKPVSDIITNNIPELRYYQKEAIDSAIKAGRGIIHHPTGSGKTIIMAELIAKFGLNSLVIVPNLVLLDQTYDTFFTFFKKNNVGRIGEGKWDPRKITISTAQTLWARYKEEYVKKFLKSIDVLLSDEAHRINKNEEHLPNTFFRIGMACSSYYRFGFTATPGITDSLQRKFLEGVTGRIVHFISIDKLIDEGYLSNAIILMKKMNSNLKFSKWRDAYEKGILENEERNIAIKTFAENYAISGKSVLIMVDEVENHAKILSDLIPSAVLLIGDDKKDERKKKIEQFKSKESKILISTVLSEEFDFKGLECVIIAAGKRSAKTTAQRIGRALRVEPGKKEAIIIDFYDNFSYLKKHSEERLQTYRDLGFEVKII